MDNITQAARAAAAAYEAYIAAADAAAEAYEVWAAAAIYAAEVAAAAHTDSSAAADVEQPSTRPAGP